MIALLTSAMILLDIPENKTVRQYLLSQQLKDNLVTYGSIECALEEAREKKRQECRG